eukprot:PhF_6_TR5932/c0_g1_i2/m.8578/K12611/DCP1B; mRNA-decapping enzyme 1B
MALVSVHDPFGIADLAPALNLSFLQTNVDPTVSTVEYTCCHVVLYSWDFDANQWMDTRVQGVLFVTSSTTSPNRKLILVNRTNRHEEAVLSYDVVDGFGVPGVEVKFPEAGQIMFRTCSDGSVHNLWFLRQTEYVDVKRLIQSALG